jgi:arabinofuranan 3-O-arabinosyltransferase
VKPALAPVTRRRAGYTALAALAYVPALLSHPGRVSADTKSYLYLDPARLFERAPSMWDPNVGLGTVTHQTIGYVFPMGPYYRTFDALSIPDWVAQRLWLGSLIFAAALGILRFARQLGRVGPGVVVSALAYAWSPYLLHYSARLSALLMPWAALGFLMALTVRALREGGWRAPIAFALVVQIVGGVNATSLVFAGFAPVLWIVWARFDGRISFRAAMGVIARIGTASIAMSLWWIAGLSIQGGYGINVLRYSETVAVVARTSTPNEVLRSLGYWFFYGRDRLGPWIEGSAPYTQNPTLILSTYGLVALAVAAAVVVRWKERGFFVALLLVGTIMAVGAHPYESPNVLGSLFKAFATTSTAGLALRSTPRAVPLIALATAMLLGAGVDAVVTWARSRHRPRVAFGIPILVGATVLTSFPAIWTGAYYGENLLRDEDVPHYWSAAAEAIDTDRATRVFEIPGADFAAYSWGVTVDPITPGLIDRPYVARELIPYGSAPSADLLNAIDRRLQEASADPNGFAELLRRLGVGTIVVRNDLEWQRYNLIRPRELAAFLDRVEGLGEPQPFGPQLRRTAEYPSFGVVAGVDERSLLGPDGPMPNAVAVLSVDDPQPIVRVYPVDGAVVLSGDGEGLVDAAEVDALMSDHAVLYSAGLAPRGLDEAVARASRLVVTDSNRKRGRRWSTVRDNLGETESAEYEPIEDDLTDARLPVFPNASDRSMSVVEYLDAGGPRIATIAATGTGNPIAYTPEDRPARAFDGDVNTSWKTSAFDRAVGDRIELTMVDSMTADRVRLVQVRNGPVDRFATRVRLRFDDDSFVDVDLDDSSRRPAGQIVGFESRTFTRFSIEVLATNVGDGPLYSGQSAVGFAEIDLRESGGSPVRAREIVRLPRDLTDSAAAQNATAPLTFVMSRLRITPVPPRYDEELSLDRRFDVPRAADYTVAGEVRVQPNAYDRSILDTVLGVEYTSGYLQTEASDVMPGCATCGAAFAFDDDPTTAWRPPIGDVVGSWIEATAAESQVYSGLALTVIADGRHSLPKTLTVDVDGDVFEVAVPPVNESTVENSTTSVSIPFDSPRRGRVIRITVESIEPRLGSSYYDSAPRDLPVAIARTGIVATHWTADDFRTASCRDDLVELDGEPLSVALQASPAAAVDRSSMSLSLCEETPLRLDSGTHTLTTARGVDTALDVDRLVLREVGPLDRDFASGATVRVLDDSRTSMRVEVGTAGQATWLVLGQSHNEGWTARVRGGDDLGPPTLVDGYANGWQIDPSDAPVVVELEWTPQRRVRWALLLSGGSCALGLAALIWYRVRRGRVVSPPIVAVHVGGLVGRGTSMAWPRACLVGLITAMGASLVVPLWAAAAVGFAAIAAGRGRRRPLALTAIALPMLVGAFIAIQQLRWEYPPIFEWPTLFPRTRTFGWLAAVVPAIVWITDRLTGASDGDEATEQ